MALVAGVAFIAYHFTFASAQQAVVRLDPSSQNVNVGDSFSVNVMLDDVSNLGSYEFTLQFDPSLAAFGSVANGTFLGSSGRTVYCPSPIVDAANGTVRFGCATSGTQVGPTGSGKLATFTFKALAEGESSLDLATVSLSDPLSNDIPAATEGGSVIIGSPTPRPTSTPAPATPSPTPGPTCAGASGGVVACLNPAGQTAFNGSNFSVNIVVNNVTALGAFQASLQFDPVIASYVSTQYGAFLGSSGRSVSCNPPDVTGNTVRLVCSTLGSNPAGPDGNGVLATVTFSAVREGIGLMSLSGFMLTDIQATVIPTNALLGASVVVEPAPTPTPGPSPTPTITPTATLTEAPTATRTPRPTWTPAPTVTMGPTPTATPVGGTATLGIAPASQQAGVGVPFSINATVDNASDLGAYELTLSFDPASLRVADVENGPLLGSSGRAPNCLGWDVEGSSVRIVCLTLGPDPAGANGSGILATFTFVPLKMGGTEVAVAEAILTNPTAGVMPVNIIGQGSVAIGPAPTPTNTPLPTKTSTPGPSPTPTYTPTPGPTPTLDPNVPAILIDPPSQSVTLGDYFEVDVLARNVTDVAAYEFTIQFDPDILVLSGISNGTFLGSTGRGVFCPTPTVSGGEVRFGCVSSGATPGVSGTGLLAEITFQASSSGESPVDFLASALADPLGKTIDIQSASGSISVSRTAASIASDIRPHYLAIAALLTGTLGFLLPADLPFNMRRRSRTVFRARRILNRMRSFILKMWRCMGPGRAGP